ncbi:cysteine desulfurase [candidate division KSB1 bacterium]|nr:MAG: cysteine desulfurase [candidate division KSB1 bacterium]
MNELVYLDNAATSFPKPEEVINKITEYLSRYAANPGRSGHKLSLEAGKLVFETRELLSELFNISDSSRIIFTSNATESINYVINSFLKENDHIITTSVEHNSVMRPLRFIERKKHIKIDVVKANRDGLINPYHFKEFIKENTKLIIINHASNVTGVITPVEKIKKIVGNIPVLLDAAQTAGCIPIDVKKSGIDLLAFTGHKSLLGPSGIGGLYIGNNIDFEPVKMGGTGSNSELEKQPEFLPDKFESGTLNVTGIAGLCGSLKFLMKTKVENIREKDKELSGYFINKLLELETVKIYGDLNIENRVPLISINMKNRTSSELCFKLDKEFNIMTRGGLHCAPAAHKTILTFPEGTLRFSSGFFNSEKDVDKTIEALYKISKN